MITRWSTSSEYHIIITFKLSFAMFSRRRNGCNFWRKKLGRKNNKWCYMFEIL